MKPALTRDGALRLFLLLLLLAFGGWLLSRSEWTEVEVPVPLRGPSATNDLYVVQEMVRRLGGKVVQPTDLAVLPGAQDTLLLQSLNWDLFPERAARLRAWVEAGGHLVISSHTLKSKKLDQWVPVSAELPPRKCAGGRACKDDEEEEDEDDDEEDEEDAQQPQGQGQAPAASDYTEDDGALPAPPAASDGHRRAQPRTPAGSPLPRAAAEPSPAASVPRHLMDLMRMRDCHLVVQSGSHAFRDDLSDAPWRLCANRAWELLKPREKPQWALAGKRGDEIVRMAVGRGSVTVLLPYDLLDNRGALMSDNGLVIASVLQVQRGRSVWFVREEERPPLLDWLWQQGWITVAAGALALAAALWRGWRRFGPPQPAAQAGRRSMAEQITGTAQFLWSRGPQALLAAQIRALDEAARSRVLNYDRLDRHARAAALAAATGLGAEALERALDTRVQRRAGELAHTLELLETARRGLLQRRPRRG